MTHESQPSSTQPSSTLHSSTLRDFLATGGADDITLDDTDTDVGSRIEEAREVTGINRAAFGAQLGVRPETISAWESGERLPRGNKLALIAGILGVSLSWLMIGHGQGPKARRS